MATGRRNEQRKLKRMTIRFYEDDLDVLRTAFPNAGYNKVIRTLVSKFVRSIEERTAQKLESLSDEALIDDASPEDLLGEAHDG